MDIAKHRMEHGAKFPYDANDKWWHGDGSNPPPANDWAHAAARGVLADLRDRREIKHGFNEIDEDMRAEIVESLAKIIRLATSDAALMGAELASSALSTSRSNG